MRNGCVQNESQRHRIQIVRGLIDRTGTLKRNRVKGKGHLPALPTTTAIRRFSPLPSFFFTRKKTKKRMPKVRE